MLSGYSYSVGEDGEPAFHAPGETVPADSVEIVGGAVALVARRCCA